MYFVPVKDRLESILNANPQAIPADLERSEFIFAYQRDIEKYCRDENGIVNAKTLIEKAYRLLENYTLDEAESIWEFIDKKAALPPYRIDKSGHMCLLTAQDYRAYFLTQVEEYFLEMVNKVNERFANPNPYVDKEYIIRLGLDAIQKEVAQKEFSGGERVLGKHLISQTYYQIKAGGDNLHRITDNDARFIRIDDIFFLQYVKAHALIRFENWLKDILSAPEKVFVTHQTTPAIPSPSNTQNNPTVRQYALYYYYLSESGEKNVFSNGQEKGYAWISKQHGISAASLKGHYNRIEKSTNRTGIGKNVVTDLERVTEMLTGYPKAHARATEELNNARNKNS